MEQAPFKIETFVTSILK